MSKENDLIQLKNELNKTVTTKFEVLTHQQMVELNELTQKAILDKVILQRRQKEHIIHKYCRDIANGDWIQNPQTITITKEGYVIDGLHRIIGGIMSGCSVLFNVTRNWDSPAVFKVMDSGTPRTSNQILAMDGMSYVSLKCGIARAATVITCGLIRETRSMSTQEIERVLQVLGKSPESVIQMAKDAGAKLLPSECMAVIALAHDVMPDVMFGFADALFGLKFTDGHPARALRKWLDKSGPRSTRGIQARVTANAIHAMAEKRSIQWLSDKLDGIDWIRKIQSKKIAAIRAIVGLQ